MKRFFHKNWPIFVILALSGFIIWPLLRSGYFSHHDDLQVMRIFEMRKCFSDLQIPCRWVPDMGYGNGYPLFNFYGVFPYYIGAIFSYLLGFIGSAKLLFFIPLVGGGIGMYFLAKELFGEIPGLVAGILFLFAPYRALDVYVRGDVAESFAIALVPLVLYYLLKLVKDDKSKFFTLAALAFSAFLLTHNISTLIFTSVISVFSIYFLFENKWRNWKKVIWVFGIGMGLSSFFILPAYLEKNLVQTEALTRAELDFRAQFVKVGQLFFDRSWNYAGSNPLESGTISYQIGWPHWWLVVLSGLVILISRKRKRILLFVLLFVVFSFGVFMTHNKSAPIWELVKILVYVQFPWRFLSFAVFASSLLGAYFVSYFEKRNLWILAVTIVVLAVALNWKYFRPEHFYYNMTDELKLSGQNFIDQQKGALLDYLPKTALEPRELAPKDPVFEKGNGHVLSFVNKSNNFSFNVTANQQAVIDVPVFDFPSWTTYLDNKETGHTRSYPTGRIEVNVPVGEHTVTGIFKNTLIRTFSNLLSLTSLVALVLLSKYGKNYKIFV